MENDKIYIKNLFKSYNGKIILNNKNLEIEKNKTTSIMGKSGIGKTTLLRILMGLEKPDKGEIIGLKNIKKSAVFQEDRLCENLSAVTNISIVCKNGESFLEIKEELEKIGLLESLDKPVKELSGGMKRRVAIVRAVMAKSDIVFLDEPFKGLDKETKKEVILYLKEKLSEKTVIMVTHYIEEALEFGNKIINL